MKNIRKYNEHSDYLDRMSIIDNEIKAKKDEKIRLEKSYLSRIENCFTYIKDNFDISNLDINTPEDNEYFFVVLSFNSFIENIDEFIDSLNRTITMLEEDLNIEDYKIEIPLEDLRFKKKYIDPTTGKLESHYRIFTSKNMPNMKDELTNHSFDYISIIFK